MIHDNLTRSSSTDISNGAMKKTFWEGSSTEPVGARALLRSGQNAALFVALNSHKIESWQSSSFDPVSFHDIHHVFDITNDSCRSISGITVLETTNPAIHTSISRQFSEVDSALEHTYKLDSLEKNRLAALEIMRFIEVAFSTNSLDKTNTLLSRADTKRLSSRSLVGLLRSTARFSASLPSWTRTYKNAIKALRQQGKNPESLFIGLPSVTVDENSDTSISTTI